MIHLIIILPNINHLYWNFIFQMSIWGHFFLIIFLVQLKWSIYFWERGRKGLHFWCYENVVIICLGNLESLMAWSNLHLPGRVKKSFVRDVALIHILKESESLSDHGCWFMEPVSLGKWEGSPKHAMGEGPWWGMIVGTAFLHRALVSLLWRILIVLIFAECMFTIWLETYLMPTDVSGNG